MTSESTEPTPPENAPEMTTENGSDPLAVATQKIAELEAALTEEKNKYLYLYADFDNFRKRSVKERSDAMKFGWENIARDMLGVIDNLERALEHMPANVDANLKAGIEMTVSQFRSALEKQGVALIATEKTPFNPEFHEAMGQEPSELPAGSITKTLVKGYTLHGRLLRPAKVLVAA